MVVDTDCDHTPSSLPVCNARRLFNSPISLPTFLAGFCYKLEGKFKIYKLVAQ